MPEQDWTSDAGLDELERRLEEYVRAALTSRGADRMAATFNATEFACEALPMLIAALRQERERNSRLEQAVSEMREYLHETDTSPYEQACALHRLAATLEGLEETDNANP